MVLNVRDILYTLMYIDRYFSDFVTKYFEISVFFSYRHVYRPVFEGNPDKLFSFIFTFFVSAWFIAKVPQKCKPCSEPSLDDFAPPLDLYKNTYLFS